MLIIVDRESRTFGPIQNAIGVLNLLSLLVGMILLSVGTFVYFAPASIFLASTLLPHFILVIGSIISLVSFFGYYGVMNEKRYVLYIHILALLCAIALQVAVGIVAFVYRHEGSGVLDRAWTRISETDPKVIRDLEQIFQCCGFNHVLDRAVPPSCPIDTHYLVGCKENIQTAFMDSLQAIGVIGAILGGIELVSLIGAVVLFRRFSQKDRRRVRWAPMGAQRRRNGREAPLLIDEDEDEDEVAGVVEQIDQEDYVRRGDRDLMAYQQRLQREQEAQRLLGFQLGYQHGMERAAAATPPPVGTSNCGAPPSYGSTDHSPLPKGH